jgi:hypothetical protein
VRSARNSAAVRTLTLRTVIPQPFVQIYEDFSAPAVHTKLFGPGGTRHTQMPSRGSDTERAIAALPGGGQVVLWDEYVGDNTWVMRYAILNSRGDMKGGVRTLLGPGGTLLRNYPYYAGLAVLPNGRIGIAWTQVEFFRSDSWEYKYNAYFAVIDANGAVVAPPADLTGNNDFGGTEVFDTRIAAAGDRFAIAWTEYVETSDG